MQTFDYRRMSFYQIWIRSFCDGNGDGIGDLYGVYDKLDYIRSLGVDGIWFSPIYPSPNADYGYDISDYKDIHPDYGTLDQFKKVLTKAHELGMKVLLDLVVNHTSDEHPWFLESCKGKDNPYSDYYIWRDPKWKGEAKLPPNNWYSQFEGLAWEYHEQREQYYLHVFAKKQPDLNMDNPKVREEVKSIMRFWLDMGVDGFREDVITFISKHEKLPDGIPFLPAINGLPFYNEGPNLHQYLTEFRRVAEEYGALQVGEAPFTNIRTALHYTSGDEKVLDMMIPFDAMTADCFLTEYVHHGFRLRKMKKAFTRWQKALAGKSWNVLYLENHDHPRIISRYGSPEYWKESGKALAAAYLFQQGTPFVYQGQEIGMTNIELPSIDDYLDVASIHAYHTFFRFQSPEKRMRRIYVSSRDSSRTPMQWSGKENAGFTDGTPWFFINRNYKTVNVEEEEKDPQSILHFYRKCLLLRKQTDALLWGEYQEYFSGSRKLYMYGRSYGKERILVIISFRKKKVKYRLPKGFEEDKSEFLLGNYPDQGEQGMLRPYEVKLLKF
ncbi:MAG: alpha-glucosidase [Blautia sp.]|nr:alpha-glucosidase [Blautia sp.]